jgi:hypothetical protein
MAHFSELDDNNIVLRVIVVSNQECLDENSQESEQKGISFCQKLFGGRWIQTSYNGNIRKNYAGIGYLYDEIKDAFIPPKPFESWVLNEDTCLWEAPFNPPDNDNFYMWNEELVTWDKIEND